MEGKRVISAGTDLGTSTIKSVAGDTSFRMPSIIGEPNPGFKGMPVDKSWERNLKIEFDGNEWYVGELARLQSVMKFPLAREGRMKSHENAKIAIQAVLSLLGDQGWNYYSTATGVPVGVSRERMEQLSESLTGPFRVTIENDATSEKKEVKGRIVAAPVMPEPYGAYYYLLKERGEQKAMDSILIDIGYGTTDILTLYKGSVLRTASSSINEAVDTLTTKLADLLSEKADTNVKPEDLMTSLESKEKKITVGGKTYDVAEQISSISQFVARSIVDEVSRAMGNLPTDAVITYFILEGGGVHLFGDTIKDHLFEEGLVSDPENLIIPEDPVMTNAMGFELIAKRYAEKIK